MVSAVLRFETRAFELGFREARSLILRATCGWCRLQIEKRTTRAAAVISRRVSALEQDVCAAGALDRIVVAPPAARVCSELTFVNWQFRREASAHGCETRGGEPREARAALRQAPRESRGQRRVVGPGRRSQSPVARAVGPRLRTSGYGNRAARCAGAPTETAILS